MRYDTVTLISTTTTTTLRIIYATHARLDEFCEIVDCWICWIHHAAVILWLSRTSRGILRVTTCGVQKCIAYTNCFQFWSSINLDLVEFIQTTGISDRQEVIILALHYPWEYALPQCDTFVVDLVSNWSIDRSCRRDGRFFSLSHEALTDKLSR